jgi:hypothetical protein
MLLRNLLGYTSRKLGRIEVNGRSYSMDPDYSPDVIVAMAFGADMGECSYNQVLADAVSDAEEFHGHDMPVFAQTDIAECLKDVDENVFTAGQVYEPGETAYAVSKHSTKQILAIFHEKILGKGLDPEKVLYISHPAHMERDKQIGKGIGFDGRPFVRSEVEWPSDDGQLWARSPIMWAPREFLVRIFRKIRGEM